MNDIDKGFLIKQFGTAEPRGDRERAILQKAIDTYGGEMQSIVAIEEMAELQKELTKALRGNLNIGGLVEEMADVAIMYRQLMIIYNIDPAKLQQNIDAKLLRLKIRMAKKEAGNGQNGND